MTLKKTAFLLLILLMMTGPIFAVNKVTITSSGGGLTDLTLGNTNTIVAEIKVSNNNAVNDFTVTVSGTGLLNRIGGTGQIGDSIPHTISMTDTGVGNLTATIRAPGLPNNYDLSTGDYNIIFDTPGTASNRRFDLQFTTGVNSTLLQGTFDSDITVTITSN